MKSIIYFLCCILFSVVAYAQPDNRVFTVQKNIPYTQLDNQTVVTVTDWDDFDADIPLGFKFRMFNDSTNTLYIRGTEENYGAELQMQHTGITDSFHVLGWLCDIMDRHMNDATKNSSVGYQTNTVNGKKITKVEYRNVGFVDGIPSDSAHLQIWFHEADQAIEYRFGPSSRDNITAFMKDPNIYGFKGPVFHFSKFFDPINFNLNTMYFVSNESPASMDSASMATLLATPNVVGVDSFPNQNVLYRWAPAIQAGFNSVRLNQNVQIFPTLVQDALYINMNQRNSYVVYVSDMQGRRVAQKSISQLKDQLQLGHLPAGQYALTFENQEEKFTYMISKQ